MLWGARSFRITCVPYELVCCAAAIVAFVLLLALAVVKAVARRAASTSSVTKVGCTARFYVDPTCCTC